MHLTKFCSKCQEEKPVDDFRFRDKTKGTRAPWCKPCYSDYERSKWKESPERRESNMSHNKVRKERNRKFIWDYLLEHPCEQCGASDPRVLEFDHIEPKIKSFTISDGARIGLSIESLETEISKCRVLCANCHRVHTYEQQGWRCY